VVLLKRKSPASIGVLLPLINPEGQANHTVRTHKMAHGLGHRRAVTIEPIIKLAQNTVNSAYASLAHKIDTFFLVINGELAWI